MLQIFSLTFNKRFQWPRWEGTVYSTGRTVVSTMPSFHPKNATSWMQWQLVLLEQMPQGLLKSITPTVSTCSGVSSTQPAAS